MTISARELEDILKIFEASDFDELLLEIDGVRVEARRNGAQTAGAVSIRPETVSRASGTSKSAVAEPAAAPASVTTAAAQPDKAGLIAVRSEIGGTFYRAPSPTEDPFVEVGTRVEVGDVLGMVEVMKLFTSVPSEVHGEVVEIVAANAAVVKAGDVLLYIRPSGD